MKYIIILILAFSLATCNDFSNNTTYQISTHEQIADRITAKVAQKIEKETGLSLVGTGGGMMDQVRMMALSFNCYGEISLEQSRELLIYCTNEYLLAINENEEIRPYLINYPFTPQNIEIRIFIYRSDRRDVPVNSLSVVAAIKGKLDYDVKKQGLPSFQEIHQETYEEAVEALKQNGPITNVRKNPCPSVKI